MAARVTENKTMMQYVSTLLTISMGVLPDGVGPWLS
jgi:hypothetical protein